MEQEHSAGSFINDVGLHILLKETKDFLVGEI